jgi:hypothetical protein
MKLFTKLALVSAIAISGNVMAMESLDDAALSAATGQDGIDLTIKTSGITIDKVLVHDNDGLALTAATNGGLNLGGTATAGAIVVNNVTVGVSATQANPLMAGNLAKVTIDTDGGATGNAVLNINAKTNGIDVGVGSIAVAASNATSAMVGARRGAGAETTIIDNVNLTVGASELNIQLGAQPQGAMIVANGTIVGGITISSLNLVDSSSGGKIQVGGLKITSANSADLAVNTKIGVVTPAAGVTAGGLSISSTGSNDIYIGSLAFGNNKSIGSVEIQGLNMGTNSILVSGH